MISRRHRTVGELASTLSQRLDGTCICDEVSKGLCKGLLDGEVRFNHSSSDALSSSTELITSGVKTS